MPDTTTTDGELRTVERTAASLGRLSALAGVLFVGLIVATQMLRPDTPSATDSGQEIVDYVTQHQGRLQLAAVLLGLAMSALLMWLPGLFRALTRAEGGTPGLALAALAGGALAAATTATAALLNGTVALRIEDLGASGVRVWWTMSKLSDGALLLGVLVIIGATAIVAFQRQVFPRWFAVASALLALASAVGAATIGYDSGGIRTVAEIAAPLDAVWVLLVSIWLWRNPALVAD